MRRFAVIAAAMALASCRTAAPSTGATAPTQAAPGASTPATESVFIRIGGSFRPESGPAALKEFVADVPAPDKGGECQVTRTSGSGATNVAAF